MLNRNDRVALKRNRSAVTWLSFLSLILIAWVVNLKHDMSYQQEDYEILNSEFMDFRKISAEKDKRIDSLIKVINYKPVDTTTDKKEVYKPLPVIKKDTVDRKIDTNKRIILKDTIK
jgi:hypothetical protein